MLSVFWICLIAVVIATANAGVPSKFKKTNRIVNGVFRTIEELPFMVQIRDPMGTFCGGTLVSSKHVLTAAHCFDFPSNNTENMIVVGGASNRSEPGVQRRIHSVSIHPEYEILYVDRGTLLEKRVGSKADVAIITLDMPFEEANQIKVMQDFCAGPLTAGDFMEVSGWGHTNRIDPLSPFPTEWAFSEQLQSVRLPIISNEECSNKLSGDGIQLSGTNVCAFMLEHDSCVSDSGGPGIYRGRLCAVVSYGIGCAYSDYPGIYTSVHAVRNFIDENIKD